MELPPPPPPSSLSLVSRAKTALHSAAAKAEKVLTDIKADLKIDRESDGQSQKGPKKFTDQEVDANDASNRSQQEVIERSSSKNEGSSSGLKKLGIPPSSVIKQLAMAIESVKNHKSINDLLASSVDPSSNKEKTGLSFSVMKSLVLREKEDKEINSSMCLLFKSDTSRGTIFALEKCIWNRRQSYDDIAEGSSWCTTRKFCCSTLFDYWRL